MSNDDRVILFEHLRSMARQVYYLDTIESQYLQNMFLQSIL